MTSTAGISIIGYLSKFGALGLGLLILSGILQALGNLSLAETAKTWGEIVLAIVVIGALISIAQRLKLR